MVERACISISFLARKIIRSSSISLAAGLIGLRDFAGMLVGCCAVQCVDEPGLFLFLCYYVHKVCVYFFLFAVD